MQTLIQLFNPEVKIWDYLWPADGIPTWSKARAHQKLKEYTKFENWRNAQKEPRITNDNRQQQQYKYND